MDEQSVMQIGEEIVLPVPASRGTTSVEQAIAARRSVRDYTGDPITQEELSQILWAAQGITDEESKKRTAPSAGALYPLELYVVVQNVEGLSAGVYKFVPDGHSLIVKSEGDYTDAFVEAVMGYEWLSDSAAAIVYAAAYARTTGKYGERGVRYVDMEVGHSAQNVYLQAGTTDLGTVMIGSFDEVKLASIVPFEGEEVPVAVMPLGRK